MNWKGVLGAAVITIVTMAIVSRVPMAKSLVLNQ